jgi:hypothetical protein
MDAYPHVAGSTVPRKDLVDGAIDVMPTRGAIGRHERG